MRSSPDRQPRSASSPDPASRDPFGSESKHAPPRAEGGPHLLLVGGGHAHVEILRRLGLARPRFAVTLVSPAPVHRYTGMLTGYLAGEYELEELTFPLAGLAAWGGVSFVEGEVVRVDAAARRVQLADGRELGYDALSFDVGSAVSGWQLPGVAEHAIPVKPLEEIVRLRERLDAQWRSPVRVVVVGGGATGVELSLTAAARLGGRGRDYRLHLLEQGRDVLPEMGVRVAARARRVLAARGVTISVETLVERVEAAAAHQAGGVVKTSTGVDHPFDLLVWAVGPSAPELFARSALPVDRRGYLQVSRSLQVREHPEIFGAGDCVTLEGAAWLAKVGVHAVHEAPVLWTNLCRRLASGENAVRGATAQQARAEYRPRRRYLYALNAGGGCAILGWGGWAVYGRAARRLKDAIDRRFMRRYLDLPSGRRRDLV